MKKKTSALRVGYLYGGKNEFVTDFDLYSHGFGHFGAPLGAPEQFYTFYAPLVSFSFIFRAIWSLLHGYISFPKG